MASMRLQLREDVDPRAVIDAIRPLIAEARNVPAYGTGPNGVETMRDRYLSWVETVEAQLLHVTRDPTVPTLFHTRRYWHIRELSKDSARPVPLLDAEINVQCMALTHMMDDLEQRILRVDAAPGHLTVLDTNILLHYQSPSMVPWTELLGLTAVRLIVPLRVIEELDAKKYARRSDLADRARRLLTQLEALVAPGGAPSEIRTGVTIEVPADDVRLRSEDADEEILSTCRELRWLTGRPLTLVTADTGLRLRAQGEGIRVYRLPRDYARIQGGEDTKSS